MLLEDAAQIDSSIHLRLISPRDPFESIQSGPREAVGTRLCARRTRTVKYTRAFKLDLAILWSTQRQKELNANIINT